MNPQFVYLAGKIDKNDWRHDLVPGLRDVGTSTGCDSGGENLLIWPTDLRLDVDNPRPHYYVGPYFVSDDHGCYHGRDSHGVGAGGTCSGPGAQRGAVVSACLLAIRHATLVFAWLDDLTAFGTLAEIGHAHAYGKRIVIGTRPGYRASRLSDLWFVFEMADTVLESDDPVAAFLAAVD